METRVRHNLCPDTISTLLSRRNGTPWRDFAVGLGYEESYAATLNKAARGIPGAMTSAAEDTLRVRLGLAPVRRVEVDACVDCGSVHTGRCHGRPVVSVVALGPGERVTRRPARIIRRWRDLPAAALAAAITHRQPYPGGQHVQP